MRLPHATLLSGFVVLKIADNASASKSLKAALDVQGLADERHGPKRVERAHAGVENETRSFDGGVEKMLHALSSFTEEHVAQGFNRVGPVTTSFARDSDAVATMVATAPEFSTPYWKQVEADAAKKIEGWVRENLHPDAVYQSTVVFGKVWVFDPLDVFAWIWYIDKYMNSDMPKPKTPITSINQFVSHFSRQVVTMIVKAANMPDPLDVMKRLKACIMCHWFNSFMNTDDVVALLKGFEIKNSDVKGLKKTYEMYFDSVSSPTKLKGIIEEFKTKGDTGSPATQPTTGTNDNAHLMARANMYDNKVFTAFDKYVNDHNTANPVETLNLLSVLIACFGEDGASSVLSAAKSIPQTADKAKSLETQQVTHWLTAKKTPDEVLELINFKSQSVQPISTLFRYFDEYFTKHSRPPFNLIMTLKKYYLDEQLIEIVIVNEESSDVDRLKNLLFLDWFNGLKSDGEVLELISRFGPNAAKIGSSYKSFKKNCVEMSKRMSSNLLKDVPTPAVNTFDSDSTMLAAYELFISEFNVKHSKMQLRLFAVLTACFGDSKLAAMIDSAKLSSTNMELVTRLEEEQTQFWISAVKSPDEVFGLLVLETGLQPRPFIDKWIKICDEFNKHRPDHWFDPIEILRTRYNDNVLASVVAKELQDSHSDSRLKDLLFLNFFDRMMTHEKLFTLLNPKGKQNTKLDLLVENYRQFVDNIGPPDVLTQIRKWCKTKRDTDDAGKQPVAGIGDKPRNRDMFLYDGKVFAAYDSFVRTHNKAKPSARIRLLAALTTRFGDRDASTMILAAKRRQDTAKVAESLEAEQIEHWVKVDRTPDQVFELLDHDFQSLSSINKWFRFIDRYCHAHQEYVFNPIVTLTTRYPVSELVNLISKEKNPVDVERLKDLVIHDLFNSMQSDAQVSKQLGSNGLDDITVKSIFESFKLFRQKLANVPDMTMIQDGPEHKLLTTEMVDKFKSKYSAHDGDLLNAYDTYVSIYNKQNPTRQLSLLAVLTARFKDFEVLAMVESAKSNSVAVKTAKLLEDKLVHHLVDSFDLHRVDPAELPVVITERLLSGPDGSLRVYMWVKCIDKLIKRHSEYVFNPIELLRKYFTDKVLATLVLTATSEHKRDAERVLDMLVLDWFNRMLTEKQLFELLDSADGDSQRKLSSIITAIKKYNKKVKPSSSSSLELIEGWRRKGLISQAECDVLKSNSIDQKLYGTAVDAYATYVRLYNEENPTKQLSLLALLTACFQDAKVFAMLDKAESLSKTPEVAKHLKADQILFWVYRGKSPTKIFDLLGFKSKSLQFINEWVEFTNIFCQHHPESSFNPFELLKTQFSDLELATFSVDATSKKSDNAERLEAVLFLHWFDRAKTRDGLEKLLGLDEATEPTFAPLLDKFDEFINGFMPEQKDVVPADKIQNFGKLFAKYDDYVRSYNMEKKPVEHLSLLAFLSALYSDEIVLKIIDEAKLVPATRESAKLVEAKQFDFWVSAKRNPADIVKHLNRQSKSPSFVAKLVDFFDRFCKLYPESSFDPIKLLKKFYSDSKLATFVVEATSMQSLDADRLEAFLFPHWFNMGITREQLYALLKLSEETEPTFAPLLDRFDEFVKKLTSPMIPANENLNYGETFAKCEDYVRSYNVGKPAEHVSLFALLSAIFGDKIVSTMIDEAKLKPKTREIAEALGKQQFEHWVDAEESVENVVELLYSGSKSLRFISRYTKFFDLYIQHHPEASQFPIKALRKFFSDDELITLVMEATPENMDDAKRLEAMLFRDWLNNAIKHDDLFTRLHLDEKKKHAYASVVAKYGDYCVSVFPKTHSLPTDDLANKISNAESKFAALTSHVDEFNKMNPTEQLSLLAVLTVVHGDQEASTMIGAAKSLATTKDSATLLEAQQIQFWVDAGRTPSEVIKLLQFIPNDPGMVYKWVEFCGMYSKFHPESPFDPIALLKLHLEKVQPHFDDLTLVRYAAQGKIQKNADARQLQDMLFRHWFSNDVTYLELSTQLDSLDYKMMGPILSAYKAYVTHDVLPLQVKKNQKAANGKDFLSMFNKFKRYADKLNKDNPTNQQSLLFLLIHHLTEETVSMILNVAEHDQTNSVLATELQRQRSARWLAKKKSPHDVIQWLGLDKLLENCQSSLRTLVKYVDDYSAEYPSEAVTLYDVLSKHDAAVAGALARSTDAKLESVEERILNELVEFWEKVKTKPYEVFNRLNFHSRGMDVLERDDFKAWLRYSMGFSFHYPMEEDRGALYMLIMHGNIPWEIVNNGLAEATREEKEVVWTDESGKAINLLKSMLPLSTPEQDCQFRMWGEYVFKIYNLNPPKDVGWNKMTFLRTIHTQISLAEYLMKAEDEVKGQKIPIGGATRMEVWKDLFDFWILKDVKSHSFEKFITKSTYFDLSRIKDLIKRYNQHRLLRGHEVVSSRIMEFEQ